MRGKEVILVLSYKVLRWLVILKNNQNSICICDFQNGEIKKLIPFYVFRHAYQFLTNIFNVYFGCLAGNIIKEHKCLCKSSMITLSMIKSDFQASSFLSNWHVILHNMHVLKLISVHSNIS